MKTTVMTTESEKNIFGPTKREEERRLLELQKKQRQESLELLGFDALESHCPYCGEKYSLMIVDPGKEIPAHMKFLSFLLPRMRRTSATLKCVSCGKEYKTPSLLSEISVPIVVLVMVALIILGDCILLSYLCRY
ncbi:hypothetical protein IJS98_00745 [bacterium]|nr:hypothetical protein [bacterium]